MRSKIESVFYEFERTDRHSSTVQYDEVLTRTDVECNIVEAVSVCCAYR